MIDRALRLAVRNYWTLFFAVAAITVPLQVAYAAIWHNVIAVRELHGAIEAFPPLRQVHGVGRAQLNAARWTFWLVVAIEVALLPLLVRVTEAVLRADGSGQVRGAPAAWKAALSRLRTRSVLTSLGRPGPLVTGAALAVVVGSLVAATGHLLIEPLSDERAFAGVGLVDGVARAAGAPFFLVVAACAVASEGSRSRGSRGVE